MRSCDFIATLVRENIQKAQAMMKRHVDKKMTNREYQEGEWVYLRLMPYRQIYVVMRRNIKLST